jgi:hypothetical protein
MSDLAPTTRRNDLGFLRSMIVRNSLPLSADAGLLPRNQLSVTTRGGSGGGKCGDWRVAADHDHFGGLDAVGVQPFAPSTAAMLVLPLPRGIDSSACRGRTPEPGSRRLTICFCQAGGGTDPGHHSRA